MVALAALCALSVSAAVAGDGVAALDKLSGSLRQVATGAAAPDVVGLNRTPDGGVVVEVRFTGTAEAAETDLSAFGARRHVWRGATVEAVVAPEDLAAVAGLPQVLSVVPPARLIPCQAGIGFGATVSEGVQLTNANSMQAAGYTGENCTIAIIDTGFAGYDEAELPTSAVVVSTRADGSTTASQHGTAMAETVADMAPDASLTLVAADTALSVQLAIDYVMSNRFDIVVMGLVLVEGPFDGTHGVSKSVASAVASGILWVQAAGNFAQRHWTGTYRDSDNDNICEFAPNVESIDVTLAAGATFEAYLSWFESAGPTTAQDYDLVLRDGTGAIVAQSAFGQTGATAPREHLTAVAPYEGSYRLQIQRISTDLSRPDTFQLYLPAMDISPATLQIAESSLPIPAEVPGALTIGATRGSNVDPTSFGLAAVGIDVIEPFSSLGPSLSGTMKPDLVGPDGCRTSLAAVGDTPIRAGGDPIAPSAFGTSFAAAHVAGAAALLLSEDNSRTAAGLRNALIQLAVDVPPTTGTAVPEPLPNNTYGNGRVSLRTGIDVTKPIVSITYPRNGDTISTTEPEITAIITDQGAGIDESTIVLTIDGEQLENPRYDANSGVLTYKIGGPNATGAGALALSRGSHLITLAVRDMSGNESDTVSSTFRVSPPAIAAGLHLLSLPFSDLASLNPSVVFGLPMEQVQVVRWVPSDATPVTKYHGWGWPTPQSQDEYASFEPLDCRERPYVVTAPPAGLGYFVNLAAPTYLNVAGSSLSSQISYEINLTYGQSAPRGWNMIGCPFPDAVTWGGVQFITNGVRQDLADAIESGVTEGLLFSLERSGSNTYYEFPNSPLSGTVQPWKGYWVHVLKDTTLVMYNSVITSEAPSATPTKAQPTETEWSLRFGASVSGGCDPANYIAVSPAASDGYDAGLDVPEPPALAGPVRVTMVRSAWGERSGDYAKDVRGSVGAGQEWDVKVECTQPDADVTVTWPDLNSEVPAGVALLLRDEDAGREVFMRTVGSYTYKSAGAGSERHLKIVAVPADQRAIVLEVHPTAVADGSVQLAYTVNVAASVTAEVHNIAGRTVARLGTQGATPGAAQTFRWNCRGLYGAPVPNGRYILRLTATTENGQAAQSVAAFNVRR